MTDHPPHQQPSASFVGKWAGKAASWGNEAGRGIARLIRRAGHGGPAVDPVRAVTGLDPARIASEQDALHRHRLAREIYAVLTAQPPSTSVRFGLFGEWGYGKTTIANWIAEIARHDGHVVVWFNPWASPTLDAMWFGLANALHSELVNRDIELSAWTEIKKLSASKWRSAGSATEINSLKGLSGLVNRVLRFDKADTEKLKAALGEHRVIVIIDDMDRADPQLLPKLLLSLREILEQENFSFLVPFDKTKVASAVQQQYDYWDGEDFLEKIFDYQLKIPPTTAEERWTLFESHVRAVLPNAPLEVLQDLRESLPDNPRRIKRVVRGIEMMKREIQRHGIDEVDWTSIFYGLILELESEPFFSRYIKVFFDTERRIAEAFRDDDRERREAARARIEALADELITDKARRARVVALAQKWEETRAYWDNHRIVYALRLFERPHAFTWEEFEGVMQPWRADKRAEVLLNAINAIARERLVPIPAAFREFAESARGRYSQQLQLAADAFSAADQVSAMDRGDEGLQALRQLMMAPSFSKSMRAEQFEQLCETFRPFAHFNGNARDRKQRPREIEVLRELASGAGDQWQRYAKALQAEEPHLESDRAFIAVKNELLAEFDGRSRELVIQTLREEGGIRRLLGYQFLPRPRAFFLDAEGDLWSPAPDAPLLRFFADAAAHEPIQKNAHTLLRVAHENFAEMGEEVRTGLRRILSTAHIAVAIWNAAIATPIQYRQLLETRRCRAYLVRQGIEEASLPYPDWLRQGEERDAQHD